MNYRVGIRTPNHGRVITPELMVWHTTEGGGKSYLDGLFSGRYGRGDGVNVSVHWCVYEDGEIVEYASWWPGRAVACWHAGNSQWKDKPSCNYWSLGCEIQHRSGQQYPEAQIRAVLELAQMVTEQYPQIEHLTHEQVAWPRGRKTDPSKPWKTDVWPRLVAALEDDMTDEQFHLLKLARLSDVARSYDVEIIKEMVAGNLAGADELEAVKVTAVQEEKNRLGL